jgi:hypothetical protein
LTAQSPRPASGPARGPRAVAGISRNVVALGIVSLLTDTSSEMLVYVIPLFLANVLAASPGIIGLIEGIAESVAGLLWGAFGAPAPFWFGACCALAGVVLLLAVRPGTRAAA